MAETGLYIGRFQPFHLGHLEVVKYVLGRVNRIVIAIGSAQYSHTLENPFTAGERITMIEHALDEAGISAARYLIVPIPDMNVHKLWVAQVVSQTPEFHVVYSNEPLTVTLFMEAGFKVEAIPFFSREEYSATEIRKHMINRQEWSTLVPKSVAEYIRRIKGDTRLQNLSGSDKLPKL
jgi:nicotinamide-nucleotide adenylyltransferase